MKKLSFFLMAMLMSIMSFAQTATIAYPGGTTTNMTGNNDAATLGLNASLWNVVSAKGGCNNHIGLNKDGSIRLYANKTDGNGNILTVSIAQGTIDEITLDIKQNATYNVTVEGNVVKATSSTTYAIGASSFSIQNVTVGATTQLQFNKITINYTAEGGETPEPEPDPETPEGAITCAQALEVCLATGTTPTTDTYTIHGYVTKIDVPYSNQYNNISFYMADTQDGGEVLLAYRVKGDANVKVGDKVEVIGTLVNYNGNTPEVSANGTYTIIEAAAGGETPDPEEPENPEDAPTYDFTNINEFTTWGSSYLKHEVTYSDAVVTFASANKNAQTITDQPVTKGGDVTLVMTDGSNLSSVKWVCKQWGSKPQTITLHYSVDGGYSYESTGITSDNFTISSDELPAGTNAVKITFSSSGNQVGITSCTIGKIDASDIVVTTVAKPTFSLLPGTYEGAQEIEILCATESATIYYTIDGTDPSVTSDVYSAPIAIFETTTIKAYAVKDGLTDSDVAEATYTITAPADFVLDLTDNDVWGFPTSKTVNENTYTNEGYEISIVGSEGQGYMFDNGTLMVGKNGSYLVLPTFNKPIEKIVTVGVETGSGSVTFNVYIGENAVSTEVKSCKVDQTFLIAEDSQVANVAHVIKVTNDNNVRFSQIKFYFGEGNGPATALENIAVEGKAVKAIINGQLIIIKNGVQYNAQGQVVK